jgi:predicted amidohydrolase YtcJ
VSDEQRSGVTRRTVLKGSAVAGAMAAGGMLAGAVPAAAGPGGGKPPGPPAGPPGHGGGHGGRPRRSPAGDLILTNGRIHTMDDADRVVSVVAIRDGEIVYTGGSVARARREFVDQPKQLNLHGRTAVPGLIDCHNHIVLMGNRPGHHTPLENAYSISDVQAIYAERARHVPAGEFITTIGGFHFNQFTEVRLPTLAELDAALPHHPAYISLGFVGPSVTNSLGKAFFESVPGPDGPVPVGADGSIGAGTPTGQATLALRRQLTFETRKRSVRDAMAYAVSLGVTTHLDQGAFQATDTPADGAAHEDNFTMHLPFLSVYEDGDGSVRLRINFLYMDQDPDSVALGERLKNAFPFFGNDLVRTGGIGEFVAPDPSFPVDNGSTNNERWLNAARRVAQAGWRAEVHSLTGTDFMAEIDGYGIVNDEFPITDLRWVVAHVPRITEEYVEKLKALGGGVNLTGWQYLSGRGPAAGPPYRMLLDNGIPVGMSSDGMQIAPMNPWIHAYYATTGKNALGDVINADQQATRQEMLAHYTRDNLWFLGAPDEDRLGILEPGRLGDVVVLNHDYFDPKAVPAEKLKQVTSVLTVLGGTVVHDAGVL